MRRLPRRLRELTERFLRSLSVIGLILGTLFFALSLTPSLVPRPFTMQGLLSGMAVAAGYGLGVVGRWLWHYIQLPVMSGRSLPCRPILVHACICTDSVWVRSTPNTLRTCGILSEIRCRVRSGAGHRFGVQPGGGYRSSRQVAAGLRTRLCHRTLYRCMASPQRTTRLD